MPATRFTDGITFVYYCFFPQTMPWWEVQGGVWQSCTAACRAGILTGEHGILYGEGSHSCSYVSFSSPL